MRKGCCVVSAVFAVIMLLSASCFSAFAAENHYYIKELKLSFDLPDDMLAITRESPETDRYFSIFGLEYSTTMSNFRSNNIYLQGMYEDSSRIFTVTMLTDEDSQRVGNYSDLSDEQLLDVENSFLDEEEYTSCTVKRYNNYVFMELQFKTQSDGETVYATQSNTVIDGNNITFALQPARGSQLTNQDYQVMDDILQSVAFDGHGVFDFENLIKNPIFLIIVSAVVLLIIIVIASIIRKKIAKQRKKIKREEKRIKNQEILKELAEEYTSQSVVPENSLIQVDNESAEDIITQFRSSKDFEEISRKNTFSIEEPEKVTLDDDIYIVSEDDTISPEIFEETKKAGNIPLNIEEKPVLRIVTPDEDIAEEYQKTQNAEEKTPISSIEDVFDVNREEYENDYFEDEYEEDDEEYDEEYPIIGSDESFEQIEDYFDEELDNDIYSRETVDDEDNYEKTHTVVSRVDKDAVKKKAKTAGAIALNGILIFLNGVKSFFIHLGYFCTNLVRLIKRNINKRKKRKAEMLKRRQQEEAKRRKQENLRRNQQNISKDANGLVKVHSRKEYTRPNSSRNRK